MGPLVGRLRLAAFLGHQAVAPAQSASGVHLVSTRPWHPTLPVAEGDGQSRSGARRRRRAHGCVRACALSLRSTRAPGQGSPRRSPTRSPRADGGVVGRGALSFPLSQQSSLTRLFVARERLFPREPHVLDARARLFPREPRVLNARVRLSPREPRVLGAWTADVRPTSRLPRRGSAVLRRPHARIRRGSAIWRPPYQCPGVGIPACWRHLPWSSAAYGSVRAPIRAPERRTATLRPAAPVIERRVTPWAAANDRDPASGRALAGRNERNPASRRAVADRDGREHASCGLLGDHGRARASAASPCGWRDRGRAEGLTGSGARSESARSGLGSRVGAPWHGRARAIWVRSTAREARLLSWPRGLRATWDDGSSGVESSVRRERRGEDKAMGLTAASLSAPTYLDRTFGRDDAGRAWVQGRGALRLRRSA